MKKEEFQQNMKDRMQQFEDGGLRLLKKGQKGIVHAIFSRFGLVLLLMLLQVGVLWSVFRWFGGLLPHYFGGSVAMSAFMVVYILNSEMDNSAKITWMVTIAILPVVGVPLFFYVKSNIGHNALKKRVTHLTEEARGLQPQPLAAAQELAEADPGAASLARYLHGKGGGYRLGRPPEQCVVGDILRLTEGSLAPVACLSCDEPCERADSCRTVGMWRRFEEITNEYFDGITVKDLMKTE